MKEKGWIHYLLLFEGIVLVLAIGVAAFRQSGNKAEENNHSTTTDTVTSTNEEVVTQPVETVQEDGFSDVVNDIIEKMTVEEKVAQLFIITPEMLTGVDTVTVAGAGTQSAINQYPVGGLIYAENNFLGKEQTEKMLSGVQAYSKERIGLPMFLAVAEEGGATSSPVARNNTYTIQPYASEITSADQASTIAGEIGKYLTQEGFNMNLSLHAVTEDPDEQSAYQGEEKLVAQLAIAQMNAYEQQGIIPVLQTFPNYLTGMDNNTPCVMMENVLDQAITGSDQVVCSLSAQAIDNLRTEHDFSGIVISAPLNDEIITTNYSAKESAIAAVLAGNDMLYLPADFSASYEAVLEAVKSGTISIEQLDQSVGRILTKKIEIN